LATKHSDEYSATVKSDLLGILSMRVSEKQKPGSGDRLPGFACDFGCEF
jgi:hypothetical protein